MKSKSILNPVLAADREGLGFQAYKLFMKALMNRSRLAIIQELRRRPMSVSELCASMSMEQSRVSHNLKCLLDCGFVSAKRDGKNRIYTLDRVTILPMVRLIDRHIDRYYHHLIACKIIRPKTERKSSTLPQSMNLQ